MEYNRDGRRYYSVDGYSVRDGASCDWREWVKVPMPFSPVRGLSGTSCRCNLSAAAPASLRFNPARVQLRATVDLPRSALRTTYFPHSEPHTRHKSAQVVAGYIREADKWTKSGLDGVGF